MHCQFLIQKQYILAIRIDPVFLMIINFDNRHKRLSHRTGGYKLVSPRFLTSDRICESRYASDTQMMS